ncbi:MAG TPA: glycoside hydrolase family 1 protein [Candidatus Obscuribacterales bacterium]
MQLKPDETAAGDVTDQAQASEADVAPLLKFPDNFLWGVATSHFQVEGNPYEIEPRGSDWATWTAQAGRILDRSTADRTCDFFSRYDEDIDLCHSLNLNAFRLSLNWPALMPRPGQKQLARDAADFYRRLLTDLKNRGFKTFVTLFHFCLPTWLAESGGWNNKQTIDEFERFTELAAKEFGDLVDFWLTLNEPLAYSYQGYIEGAWPPGRKGDYIAAFEAIRNMLEAHARSYHKLHQLIPDARVSFTVHWIPFQARNKMNPLDNLARFMRDEVFNHVWMRAVETGNLQFPPPVTAEKRIRRICGVIPGLRGTVDYLGINYYTRQVCEYGWGWPPDIFGVRSDLTEFETSALGWEVYPQGLYELLTQGLDPYRFDDDGRARDIYITENGFSSMFSADLTDGDWSLNDELRISYLNSHLQALHKAIGAGANVKGYLHWSLLDNFEWAEGLRARFGLVRVAYPTLERTLRKSAYIYSEIAKHNAIENPRHSGFRQPR